MKSLKDPYILQNGVGIPCIGFGTWQTPDGETAVSAVSEALKAGYRHIDTAFYYHNEKSIGKAVHESGIDRKELFITSKLWNEDRGYDKALRAFDKTMDNLGLEYLDLYLIHWPAAKGNWQQVNTETWNAFERLYNERRIRSIGVSNFKVHHLEKLMEKSTVVPMVNQIEFHPGFMQTEILQFCREHSILIEAWSPLGSGKVLSDEQLGEIAARYGKSVAQLCIKWCLQHQTLPLPKSVTPERIRQNADVFDFDISAEDMKKIDGLPYIGGSGLDPDKVNF